MRNFFLFLLLLPLLISGCDSSETSLAISPGESIAGSLNGTEDVDIYAFSVASTSKFYFELSNISPLSDFDLYLRNSSGWFETYSATSATVESFLAFLNPGNYTVEVYSYDGSGPYQLSCTEIPFVSRSFCINNGNGTYTFLTIPNEFYPDATGHNIYLAGEMNNWCGSSLSISTLPNTNSIIMTNRGDGYFIAVVSNVTPGMKYKYIVDYDDGGDIDNSTEWMLDPANPDISFTDAYNSVVP